MDKNTTINEKEQTDAIYESFSGEFTKKDIDRILDRSRDLMFNALSQKNGIKASSLGTLEIRSHQAGAYKVPNPLVEDPNNAGKFLPQTFTEGFSPAGFHVKFVMSEALKLAMNPPLLP